MSRYLHMVSECSGRLSGLFFRMLCLAFILHFQCSVFTCPAQTATYPVQVSTNLIPPYSLYLSDYAQGAREHVSVTLINRDANRPGLNVRLRLTVKGQGFTIQTLPQAVFAPITIDPHIPYRLSQQELAPYFEPSALSSQGVGMQSYRGEGRLPEGMLQFCFEVVEYGTGRLISQQGCGAAWLAVQKPPQLSLPFNKENVTLRDPLNLLFQWTPRHSGLAGIEYELIVKQLFDNGMAPEAAFAYSPEIVRERTRNTSLLYGAMMSALTPGYRYAWAVRAVASDGFAEQRVFENDGLSEIRVFSLEEYCPAVTGASATWERGVTGVQWQPRMEHREYAVAYREKDSNADWQYVRCENPPARITDMQVGRTYEYRVGSACGLSGNLVYGQMLTVAVPAKDTAYLANCGIAPDIDLSNREPLESLLPGEQFMAYDFPVTALTVSGGNGVFTGTGWTNMPGMFNFAKYKLKFNNITINTDRRMIAGYCESISDPNEGQIAGLDDLFEGGALYGTVQNGITKADVTLDFSIDDLTQFTWDPETGTLTATTGDGQQHEIPVPAPAGDRMGDENTQLATFEEFTVQDRDGNIYKVAQEPDPQHPGQVTVTVTPVGKAGDTLTADNFNPKIPDRDKAMVTFRRGGSFYAFDTWQDYYEKAYLIRDKYENMNQIYRVPFKLLPSGKSDVVEATIDIKDESIDPAKVVFKTPKGTEFVSKYENGVYTINLTGGEAGDGQEVYATYKSGNKYLNFGKLIVVSYREQTYKAVIVPVNETDMDITAIRQTLKDIYGPVGIHWEITEEKGYYYFGENKFFEEKSGLLNSYTPAMREMNADFRDNFRKGDIDPQANYVFILKYSGSTMDRDAAGFMPRGGQFGYIFTKDFQGDAEILQTIAHELGHGKLLLKHTFDKDYGIAQGTTDNLMDYARGKTHLAKWQWDILADPGIAQGVFDTDQDGMSRLYTVDIDKEIEKELTNTLTSLRAESGIFSKVYNTLVQSDHIFKVSMMNLDDPELYKGGNNIIGGYFRQGSCKIEFDQENWTWNFQIIYPGTEKTPHNIVFQPEINITTSEGKIEMPPFIDNKGTVFEEFFHAGQRLYYASRRIVSLYEEEVEVEVAKAFEYYCKGWIDEYKELPMVKLNRYNLLGYSQVKAYFDALINKTEITQTMGSQFREAVKAWGKDVIAKDYQERINAVEVTNYKGATDYFDYLTKE